MAAAARRAAAEDAAAGSLSHTLQQAEAFVDKQLLQVDPKPQTPNPKPQTTNPNTLQPSLQFIAFVDAPPSLKNMSCLAQAMQVTPETPNPKPQTPNP